MKLKRYLIFSYGLIISYLFIYTLGISFDINKQLNIVNMIMLFITFLIWLYAWYLFFVKDILKSNELERNRISLVLLLLGVIMFYYNPLPYPSNYYIDIPRISFFIIIIVFFISFIIFSKGKKFFITGIFVITPIAIQSFFINVLEKFSLYKKFPIITWIIIAVLLIGQFAYYQLKNKKDAKPKI